MPELAAASPLLDQPGAVAGKFPDDAVAWHYGDPMREQRALVSGAGSVDLSHREVIRVTGSDRRSWLHALTTQHLLALAPAESTSALVLDHRGHIQHAAHVVDDGASTWLVVERGTAAPLVDYLTSMRFWTEVTIEDVTADYAVLWQPVALSHERFLTWVAADALGGRELLVPRAQLRDAVLAAGAPAGTWAHDALRVAARVPRMGFETDHRTIPHEVGWLGSAVSLDKGCYRGQETVARVHNLGRPPRRLVLLHLDGSVEHVPAPATPVLDSDGRQVGLVGTAARHFELGPIALALVKRSLPGDGPLFVDGVAATQDLE